MEKQSHHHSHSHAAGHAHGHHHSHSHSHGGSLKRMSWAFALNLGFAIIEVIGGLMTNSVAILSDALHDFGDALAMLIAIGLEKWSHKGSDQSFSYGYRRFSTLGAVITGVILVVGSIFILTEAIPRLMNPQQPHTNGMILLAVFGVAVNGFAAYRISHGTSLNEKMLMWHMLEDLMGWVLVLIGAIVMKFFDIPQLDAGMAIALSIWILYNVVRNLKEAIKVFLMASPTGLKVDDVIESMKKIPHVIDVHHAHLWSLDGEQHVFTAHLVLDSCVTPAEAQNIKAQVKKKAQEFGILEATIETELSGAECVDPQHP
jgi:cation diffusion facilitator family transporter